MKNDRNHSCHQFYPDSAAKMRINTIGMNIIYFQVRMLVDAVGKAVRCVGDFPLAVDDLRPPGRV